MMNGSKRTLKIVLIAAIVLVILGTVAEIIYIRASVRIVVPGQASNLYEVTRVVDGDTIVVATAGGTEKIRLIGINTPETVDPRKPVECFGKEASQRTHELIERKTVRIEVDATTENRDKYGRLLRYVYLPDGTSVNESLVRDGYARENSYGKTYSQRDRFRAAEAEARAAHRGLWNPSNCPQDDPLPTKSRYKKKMNPSLRFWRSPRPHFLSATLDVLVKI